MKIVAVVVCVTSLVSVAAAELPPDYAKKIDRWKISGRFFDGGISCSATVDTSVGWFMVSRVFIGNSWQSMFGTKDGVAVVSDEQANGILEDRYLYKNGKRIAETRGSLEVLQEFNRCIEAGMFRDGGE